MSATGAIGKKILIGIVAVPAFFVWQHWNKGRKADAAKADMIEMCEEDERCIDAVEKFAAGCYRDNYQTEGRRGSVDVDEFVACINHRSGETLFVASPAE